MTLTERLNALADEAERESAAYAETFAPSRRLEGRAEAFRQAAVLAEDADVARTRLLVGLQQLREKWRASAASVRREMTPGGIREYQQEGPRYGIAAVESCADELDALIAEAAPKLELRNRDTPENRAFWQAVDEAMQQWQASAPAWWKALHHPSAEAAPSPSRQEKEEDQDDTRVAPLKAGADGQDLAHRSQPGAVTAAERTDRCRAIRQTMREGRIVSWDDTMWMLETLEAR